MARLSLAIAGEAVASRKARGFPHIRRQSRDQLLNQKKASRFSREASDYVISDF